MVHLSLQKKGCFKLNKPEKVEQQEIPPIQILMWTYHNGVKQAVVKRKILEYISVGDDVELKL